MRFWTREIAGWLLVGLGVFGFYLSTVLLLNQHILEAGPMTFIAFILFRGGLHLLKVAVAARVCLQAQQRQEEERATACLTTPGSTRGRPLPRHN